MDAYEIHKKIQEAIMLVDIYQRQPTPSSQWHAAIKDGLDELSEKRRDLLASSHETCPGCGGSGIRSSIAKRH